MIGLQLLTMMGLSAGAAGSTANQNQNQNQPQGQAGGVAFQSMLGQLSAGGGDGGGMVISANGSVTSAAGATMGVANANEASNLLSSTSSNGVSAANGTTPGNGNAPSNGIVPTNGASASNGIGIGLSSSTSEGTNPAQIATGVVNVASTNAATAGLENGQVFTNLGTQTGLVIENNSGALNSQTLSGASEQTGTLTVIPNPAAAGLGETIVNVIASYKNQYGATPQQANGKSSDPDQPLILIGEDGSAANGESPLINGLQIPANVDLSDLSNQGGMMVSPNGNATSLGAEVSAVANGQATIQNAQNAKTTKGTDPLSALLGEEIAEEGELSALPIAGSKGKKLANGAATTGLINKGGKSAGSSGNPIVNAAQSGNETKIGEAIAGADTTTKQAKLFEAIAQSRLMNDQMDKFGLKGNSTTVQANTAVDPMVAQQGSSASQTTLGAVQALQGTTDASTHDISVSNNSAPGRHTPTMPAAQLGMRITKALKDGANEFQIRLDPAELGRIDVRLTFSASGKATAHIMAENKESLALLQRDAHVLERALQDAGVKTDQNSLNFSLKEQGRDHERFANHNDKNSNGAADDDQEDFDTLSDEDITNAVLASMNTDQGLDIRI